MINNKALIQGKYLLKLLQSLNLPYAYDQYPCLQFYRSIGSYLLNNTFHQIKRSVQRYNRYFIIKIQYFYPINQKYRYYALVYKIFIGL